MGTELSGLFAKTISTYSSCKRSRLNLKPSIICLRERPFSVSALREEEKHNILSTNSNNYFPPQYNLVDII